MREGEIVALLGRNGAGKTTTLRSLVGLTPAREGTVHIFGHATTGWPPFRIAGSASATCRKAAAIFPNLTVEENLLVPMERPGPWTIARIYRAVSAARRTQERTAAASCPAANRKCWRSHVRCC